MKDKLIQNVKYIIFTLFVVGLGLMAYSAYQYYSASQRINEINDERAETQEMLQSIPADQIQAVNPQPIAGQDIALRRERNEKYAERDSAVRMAGIGLAMAAAAWLIRDLVVGRQKKSAPNLPASENSST